MKKVILIMIIYRCCGGGNVPSNKAYILIPGEHWIIDLNNGVDWLRVRTI